MTPEFPDYTTMNVIQDMWKQDKCPLVNGIIIIGERYHEFDIVWKNVSPGNYRVSLHETSAIPVKDLLTRGDLGWVEIDTYIQFRWEGFLAKAGAGAFGGDGFIGVQKASGHLLWLAFFQNSNPFVSLSMSLDMLQAVSNTGITWGFPLQKPSRIQVL
jgi:hypothetical protein